VPLDVDLGVDQRQDEPVLLPVGPVLSIHDAVGSTVGALDSRDEVRDHLDFDAIRTPGRFSDEQPITAAACRPSPRKVRYLAGWDSYPSATMWTVVDLDNASTPSLRPDRVVRRRGAGGLPSVPMSHAAPDLLADLPRRLAEASAAAAAAGIDVLLITPGPDLRYLTGYEALPLERLTCLVVRTGADPVLVVPALERPAALAGPVADLGLTVADWQETDDPFALVASLAGPAAAGRVALDDHMHAAKVLRLRDALPGAEQVLAGTVLGPLRRRKTAAEVAALQRAGTAIDAVHAGMAQWLRPGRTEAQVGRDIADAILAAGHARVDFVIVGSGPNGASPHHELSGRVIEPGDPVVVDIGGTMPDGYCSDSTRMYAMGEPPADFLAPYADLQAAHWAAVQHVRPGVTCASVDEAARAVLREAGWGDAFIHRTGHGIGLETHEEPYLVAGNELAMEPGFAFSIEPGVYFPRRHGARIEDIVVCGDDGPVLLNHRPRELQVL
jgi:Xaa-Pro aminopeptidase